MHLVLTWVKLRWLGAFKSFYLIGFNLRHTVTYPYQKYKLNSFCRVLSCICHDMDTLSVSVLFVICEGNPPDTVPIWPTVDLPQRANGAEH